MFLYAIISIDMGKQKKSRLKKVLKYHFFTTGFFLFFYLVIGIFGGKQLLFSDIQNKGRVAGAMISAVVRSYGPPQIPVVSVSSGCTIKRAPFIQLDWPVDQDATSFDIYRNGAELMLGLNDNFYIDSNITSEIIYDYYVIANGPKGMETSETVSTSVSACPTITNPNVAVTIFEGNTLDYSSGIPKTTNKKPVFSGTTNIPNAILEIQVQSAQIIYATKFANENGFWQWIPPVELSEGTEILYVKAIDPIDDSITANASFQFIIEKKKQESDDDNNKHNQKAISPKQPIAVPGSSLVTVYPDEINSDQQPPQNFPKKPIDFEVNLESKAFIKGVSIGEDAYRGESLGVEISFTDVIEEGEPAILSYLLIDSDQKIVAQYSDSVFPKKNDIISKNIPLSYKLNLGKYKLQVNATIGNAVVSHENYFILKDRPIIKIGAGTIITYAEVVSHMGWVSIFCILLLVLIAMLTSWEHHLYKKSLFHITEKFLKQKGFIT